MQHHQSYGYRDFFSEDTVGCAVCCDSTGIAGLCYIRVQYGFSHADRVFVIGYADCQLSTIQPKRKGELSVMLLFQYLFSGG